MKKTITLSLIVSLIFSLCACGNNYKASSPKEEMAYTIIKEMVDRGDFDGFDDTLGFKNVVFYDYNESTLVHAEIYLITDTYDHVYSSGIIGIFDDTTLKESYLDHGKDVYEYDDLYENISSMSGHTYEVPIELCDALGISTYENFWKEHLTPLACDYIMEYMNYLKNPYTLEINSVDACIQYMDSNNQIIKGYNFTVNLTAENNLGGKVTKTIGNPEHQYISSIDETYFSINYEYVENETFASKNANHISLDETVVQKYLLENF